MGIQINGNTDNISAVDGDLSITGVTTFSQLDVGSNIKLGNAGVVTATRFVGETNGLVNVKTYGAVGDGTTDDRAAIQSAINSAKTVFFPAGTYRVGAALTVWDSYTALIGHESLPTIKVVGTGYSGPAVSVQSAGNDINEFSRIENLKFVFDNNSGGPATYSSTPNETNCGVSINGSLAGIASATNRVLRFKMENCRVLGFSNAINLKETTNTLLRRVVIEHEFDQSSTTLSPSNIYCGVNFDGTPGQVGGISPQASVELHQVIFNGSGAPTNTTSMGFRVTGQDPRDIFFEGCETAHGNYGWFIDPSHDDYNIDIHINRPIIDTVDNSGIYVKDWNGIGALTINGGYVVKDFNNSGAGIWVENSRGVNITGGIQVLGVSQNNVDNDEGIRIKDSKICSVSSSTIMNCRYGISLEDSSNCTVTGNIIGAELHDAGTFASGTNPVLSDAIRVFGFDGDPSDNNTITGNTIKGASASYKYLNGIGINTTSATENIICSNSIDDSSVTNRITDIGIRTNIIDRGFIGVSTTTGGKLLVGGGTGSAIEFNDSSTRLEIPASNTLAAYTSGDERIRISSTGNLAVGTQVDAGNTLRYFDVANYNTGANAGVVERLLTTKSDGTGAAGLDIVKYKSGGAYLINYEVIGSDGFIAFSTGENGGAVQERLRINATGNLKIATAGKGIDFSANTALSGASNVSQILDHYEEGTYVPTWSDVAANPTSYRNGIDSGTNSNGLSYVRIGKQVTVTGAAFWSGASINNTRPYMSLPFPARTYSVSGAIGNYSLGVNSEVQYLNYNSTTLINFFVQTSGGGHGNFGDNSTGELYFNITYMTY